MSPLQIKIMLHYYSSVIDWEEPTTLARFKEGLRDMDMLELVNPDDREDAAYALSARGRAYVDYILSISIPVETTIYTFPIEESEE